MTGPRFILALEDGRSFFGFRALDEGQEANDAAASGVGGEAVFCTAMTGYQEICTDPSFRGQITTLTYPLIDNYGVNPDDVESARPWLTALVVRESTARARAIGAQPGPSQPGSPRMGSRSSKGSTRVR